MTFEQIVARIANRISMRTPEALERIGEEVNDVHRSLVRKTGVESTITGSYTGETTDGSRLITFGDEETGVIKVQDVLHPTSDLPLTEISPGEMDMLTVRDWPPSRWAVESVTSRTVIIRFDAEADATGDDVVARVKKTTDTMEGDDEPAIPENWHDLLVDSVLEIEYETKLKDLSASKKAADRVEKGLAELTYHLAESRSKAAYQGKTSRRTIGNSI